MNTLVKIQTLLFTFILLGGLVIAQEGLYDPAPPADSAFVRIIHADNALEPFEGTIGDVTYESIEYGVIGAYQVIPAGTYDASFSSLATSLDIAAGKFYSVAVVNSEAKLLEDPVNGNVTKSMLVLYNLSEAVAVDMKTADGSTPVITGVESQALNNILVNPIEVELAAFSDDKAIKTFSDLTLRESAVYSMVVVGSVDELSASWSISTVIR